MIRKDILLIIAMIVIKKIFLKKYFLEYFINTDIIIVNSTV